MSWRDLVALIFGALKTLAAEGEGFFFLETGETLMVIFLLGADLAGEGDLEADLPGLEVAVAWANLALNSADSLTCCGVAAGLEGVAGVTAAAADWTLEETPLGPGLGESSSKTLSLETLRSS